MSKPTQVIVKHCPMCKQRMKAGDILMAQYIPAWDWFMLRHLVPLSEEGDERNTHGAADVSIGYGTTFEGKSTEGVILPGYKSWCSEAEYEMPRKIK